MTVPRERRVQQRHQESRLLRAKAPIAARFEDCFQAFQQLSDSLQVNESNTELHRISKEHELRFKIWGDDSGASSRALDHALRKCPVVKRQTLSLLKELRSTLAQAITGARLQDPADPDAEDGVDSETKSKATNTTQIADDVVPDDPDMESTPELFLEEVNDIIGYLVQLLPALRDPLEDDGEIVSIHDADTHSEDTYRQLAGIIFPTASRGLLGRLGYSNWRRRRNVWRSSHVSNPPEGRTALRRPIKGSLTPWTAQMRRSMNPYKSYSVQNQSTLAESEIGQSTIMSDVDTVLTKIPLVDQDSSTTVTDASQASSVLQLLTLPEAPVDLTKTQQFDCPYCHFELPLAFSSGAVGEREWAAHVYHDLKPYMCTFDDCVYEGRLYGDKSAWFQHELNFHRSQPVWSCNMCQTDFMTADHLEAHLKVDHDFLSTHQLSHIQESCTRYYQDPAPQQHCNMCGQAFDNINELEDHVGNHLETFALATLLNEELLDEEELEGYEIVADYIAGLPERQEPDPDEETISADTQTHPETLLNNDPVDTDTSHLLEPSDQSALDNTESDTKKIKDGHWTERVKTFLDKQTTHDTIPTVLFNVHLRYENFVGRDVDLQSIHKYLSTPGRICTVSGRGGIGKTAIAVEYLYKYQSEYSYVFWVEAGAPGLCAEKYGQIASCLNLVEKPFADEDARMYLVRESLAKSERRWLLIFDNVASWPDISRYIPRNLSRSKGSVLITTRSGPLLSISSRNPVHHLQRPVELDVWPLEHGREFLLTSIQPKLKREDLEAHDEYASAKQVVELVGCLPLAISMIVGYVKVSRCTLADFLEMWEERETGNKDKRKIDIDGIDIDTAIDSLWAIGIREVRVNSRRLLDILSFLDPDTIQKSLLVGDHKEKYLEFLNSSETLSYKRMINELSGRRLLSTKDISNGEQAYTIHRLLQQKILLDMEDFAFADAFRKAFRLIRKRFPVADSQQVPDPQSWDTCQEYIPHVFRLRHVYDQNSPSTSMLEPAPIELAGLFYDAAFYIWARQTTAYDPLSFLGTAEKIIDDIGLDQNDKTRADILVLTCILLLNMGCVERAKGVALIERGWEIRKHIYNVNPVHDNDVLLQNAVNEYSLFLLNEHRFEEAGKLIKGCRDRYLEWGPESINPFENSKYYGNYSTVLMWRGEMDEALKFQEIAMQLTEKFSGKKALYNRRAFTLANIRLQAGDIQGALDKHLEVLAARLELQGKHHEHTIMSTYAVGAMYHHLGDLDTATKYIQQCIECVKISNWDAAAFARAKYHLALLYREQNIEEDAAAAMEAEAMQVVNEFGSYAAECVRGVNDKMMILDDLQPSFLGRYTGRSLLKHLQKCLKQE